MIEAWPFAPFTIPTAPVVRVGAYPLHGAPVFHVDPADYAHELAQKCALLAEDQDYYLQARPESRSAQWELLVWGLRELARAYPQWFTLRQANEQLWWHNRLLEQTHTITPGDDSIGWPIDWLGRQVQEDLLLLAVDEANGHPLIAGQLCFPNRWCLNDKLGLPLAAIHDPVPGYADQVARATNQLISRLQPQRPVWRRNWSLAVVPDLDLSPRRGSFIAQKAAITADNAGERIFYRVERQTLVRLHQHSVVLFTVRTYVTPLARLTADPVWAAGLRDLVQQLPPTLLDYKGITPYLEPLLEYLARCSEARRDSSDESADLAQSAS